MEKWSPVKLLMVLAAAAFMALSGISATGEETGGYSEEAGGYSEEAAGYGEEAAGYGDEKTFVPLVPPETTPVVVSKDKPGSLDELIMWYDSSSCQECHEDIYEAWESSPHARPLMGLNDLIFLRPILRSGHLAVKHPKQATQRNFPCFKCHLPQAMNLPNPVYAQIARAIIKNDKETIRQLSISCMVCHNEMAITHKLLYGKPEESVVYGKQDLDEHEHEIYTTVKRSVIMKRSVMCGQCHGLGPNLEFENPVQCATLYGSYLHNYIPKNGAKSCQECHMKDADHSFPPDFNRKKETSARLAESITLDVETLGYQFLGINKQYIPTVSVNTQVTSAAGHRIPDG
jgi:hypothetical protein